MHLLLMIQFCALASGSAGNATLLATGSTRILIDDGLSMKELKARLNSIGEDIERLDAILVTHEHSDHVGGLPVLAKSKKLRAPIYLTEATSKAVTWSTEPRLEIFRPGAVFQVGDIAVMPFSVPHDAVDPVGYRFEIAAGVGPNVCVAVLTDLGYISDTVRDSLTRTDLLLLEANHDLDMLKVGPYPWPTKQRVMGRFGHLSNDAMARFIGESLDQHTARLVLGHLSEHNNHPDLARMSAAIALEKRGLTPAVSIAEQDRPSEVFEF